MAFNAKRTYGLYKSTLRVIRKLCRKDTHFYIISTHCNIVDITTCTLCTVSKDVEFPQTYVPTKK